MSNLLIVESPAKCKKIQGFLGAGWHVLATMGHIRALEEDIDAVGIDRDFEPRYAFLKEKSKAIAQLKDAAKGAQTIYLATDDDREGEAIAFSVAVLLGLNVATTPRSVFHEITSKAIKTAVAQPRRLDMNRVFAQQARAVLDMMVGFTISPLLWKYIGPALSAGRCQTPALRILCDREKEIKEFKTQTAWRIKGTWQSGTDSGFSFQGILKDELEDQESALNYLENLHDDTKANVLHAITKQWTESAPKPLITSTLQQEASALFSSPPKKTMMIAQKLYEAGHITYMRTDHPILSEEAIAEAQAHVVKAVGEAYIARNEVKKTKTKEGAPAAQEAHEAIRPTHFNLVELSQDEAWDALDTKIYKLIWNRAVQSVMAAAKGDERAITFVANGDPGELPWEAKWRRTTFLGWRKIGTAVAALDEADGDKEIDSAQSAWLQAISLREGDSLHWKSLEASPQTSKPSARYNEATLVRELEKKGIGRPSTYATLVGTLFDKKYAEKKTTPAHEVKIPHFQINAVNQWPPQQTIVSKMMGGEKDKMVPTALGLSMLDFCVREFSNLFDYGFTAQMESRLDSVAHGTEAWKQVCRDTWNSYKDTLETLRSKAGVAKQSSGSNAKVREFSGGLKAVMAKKGPLLLQEDPSGDKDKTTFYGWPDGTSFQAITEEQARAFIQTKAAEKTNGAKTWGTLEGIAIVQKKGPFGAYVEWNGVKAPLADNDTLETLQVKLQSKKESALHTLGEFEFRKGPYGVFMFKKAAGGKKPVFVGLPEGLDPKTLTLEAATRIYSNGVQEKKTAGGGRGGFRGRGRGGFRGRGRGGRVENAQIN